LLRLVLVPRNIQQSAARTAQLLPYTAITTVAIMPIITMPLGMGRTTTITVATMLILVTITFIITMTTATSKSHLRRADSRASLMLLVGSMTSVSTSLPPLLSVWPLRVSCAFQQVHRVLDVRNSQGTRSGKPQCSALRSACDPSNRRPTSVPRGLAAVSSSHAGLPDFRLIRPCSFTARNPR
jgi:hypothetical protein